jgi:hypothetical protein
MNSSLKYLLFIAIGIIIGSGGMYFFKSKDVVIDSTDLVETADSLLLNKNQKKGTSNTGQNKSVQSSKEEDLSENNNDSEIDVSLLEDTLDYSVDDEEYFEMVSERLIAKRNVTVEIIKPDSIDASDLLNLKADSYAQVMSVEFWESPLDLIGYELNRSRLKLFGFNAEELVTIKNEYDSEKLIVRIGSGNAILVLEKSPKFKSIILK